MSGRLRAKVCIGLKPGVLDPEAQAIGCALRGLGFSSVAGLRKSKVIELDLATADRAAAESEVRRMCEKLLANPVIETYTIELAD